MLQDRLDQNPPARLLGRPFGPQALSAIREEISLARPRLRAEIARRVCQRLAWRNPRGQDALMSARVALLRLQAKGLIELPAPRNGNGNGKPWSAAIETLPPEQSLGASLSGLRPVELRVVSDPPQSRLWNSLIAQYHYLGHSNLPGAQVRYLIYARNQLLGAIGFGAAAWALSLRDQWIGWTPAQRRRSLPLVLNNARFLILPWVRVPHLASHLLARCARQLPADFSRRYGWSPALLETFVQDPYPGACYRAAQWIYLGRTRGRGKKGPHPLAGQTPVPVKHLWVYPLARHFRCALCSEEPLE
jgi:hypothetical protein